MDTRVHISLEVQDLQKSVEFYSRLFGTGPTKLKDDYANFRLESPQLHLALVHSPAKRPGSGDKPPGALHYGIELFSAERLSSWQEVAKASGFNPRIEEEVTCCYAKGNKFWVADPDSNQWEFWVRTDDIEDDKPVAPARSEKSASCCAPGQC